METPEIVKMASETMESSIMMEVASIRRYVREKMFIGRELTASDKRFISDRLNSIEQTLNEGDPGA